MSSNARAIVRITNEKKQGKFLMRASRGLKWENKVYKLKRSITSEKMAAFGDKDAVYLSKPYVNLI